VHKKGGGTIQKARRPNTQEQQTAEANSQQQNKASESNADYLKTKHHPNYPLLIHFFEFQHHS